MAATIRRGTKKIPTKQEIARTAAVSLVAMEAPSRNSPVEEAAEKVAETISSSEVVAWFRNNDDMTVPEILEAAIRWTLDHAPKDFDPRQWAITMGILMDKWLLINNKPTQRLEQILSGVLPEGFSASDIDSIIREAQSILGTGEENSGDSDSSITK